MSTLQTDFSLVFQAIISVAAAVAAYYGFKNHQVGKSNATKIDTVQGTVDGAAHTLAANLTATQTKNEDLIRALAASAAPIPPP